MLLESIGPSKNLSSFEETPIILPNTLEYVAYSTILTGVGPLDKSVNLKVLQVFLSTDDTIPAPLFPNMNILLSPETAIVCRQELFFKYRLSFGPEYVQL